jgi:DNA-binding NarL/FixJ family response regulator
VTQVIRIMTIDDHPTTRGGIAYALRDEAGFEIVAEGSSGSEAILLHALHRPHVTLMDLRLPDMSGIVAMQKIQQGKPEGRFIILTTYGGDVPARRAYRAGAAGYLLKSMLSRDLIQSIRSVHGGELVVPPEIAESMSRFDGSSELTDREVAVLRLVARGNSNKLIAADLNVSAETIKGHMRTILAKLKAEDRTHAVTVAQQRGFWAD